jgi:ABC-type polysaccharide/polyol phosphate export permease
LALVYSRPLSWTYSSGIINLGNKSFGISGTLRRLRNVCPKTFFTYDWKKEIWNIFCIGILIGGIVAFSFYQTQIQLLLMLALEQN